MKMLGDRAVVTAIEEGSDTAAKGLRVGNLLSTIASTLQQMSMSFRVAAASLAAALFIPDRFHADAGQMIHGVHKAFIAHGLLTILSAAIFRELRPGDGGNVSRHQEGLPEG